MLQIDRLAMFAIENKNGGRRKVSMKGKFSLGERKWIEITKMIRKVIVLAETEWILLVYVISCIFYRFVGRT